MWIRINHIVDWFSFSKLLPAYEKKPRVLFSIRIDFPGFRRPIHLNVKYHKRGIRIIPLEDTFLLFSFPPVLTHHLHLVDTLHAVITLMRTIHGKNQNIMLQIPNVVTHSALMCFFQRFRDQVDLRTRSPVIPLPQTLLDQVPKVHLILQHIYIDHLLLLQRQSSDGKMRDRYIIAPAHTSPERRPSPEYLHFNPFSVYWVQSREIPIVNIMQMDPASPFAELRVCWRPLARSLRVQRHVLLAFLILQVEVNNHKVLVILLRLNVMGLASVDLP